MEDLVKIEFGAHIDGYPANIAHTMIVGGKAKDKKADCVLAAYDAFIAATRLIKQGGLNQDVTAAIAKVCAEYGVEPMQGVLSHKVKKHLIDVMNALSTRKHQNKESMTGNSLQVMSLP